MKALLNRFIGASHGHKVISREQAVALQLDAQWQDPTLPEKQFQIVSDQLKKIAATKKFPPHMQAIVEQMKLVTVPHQTVLEIGCSSGYNNEVFRLAGLDLTYTGCDYSEAFIALAKKLYPQLPFQVADATALPYTDKQFDVAISGCCILHILDYPKAIAETARVTKRYAIFSRTPVIHLHSTIYTKKLGYGVPMVEIIFNEAELFTLFRDAGLAVVASTTFDRGPAVPGVGESVFSKTYLCERL